MIHRHVWSIKGVNPIEVYSPLYDGYNAKPVSFETDVLYVCLKCSKIKTKTIKGNWTRGQLR